METLGQTLFVFAVVGTDHVKNLSIPLRELQKFTNHDIIVIQARSKVKSEIDRVIEVQVPHDFNNHEASIWIKTRLPTILEHSGYGGRRFCYLDSDVIALSPKIDEIFDHQKDMVCFAHDHAAIDKFSHWAVHCGCLNATCPHLREALLCDFGIDICDVSWLMWNGGVFVADDRSQSFFDAWHTLTNAALKNPYWQTRDQATLAGTVWKLGLQNLPKLPKKFNYVLDCMRGVAESSRKTVTAQELSVLPDFSVNKEIQSDNLVCLHLINQGVGRKGWRHWDEVEKIFQLQKTQKVK